ncbi:MAG: hypothetical protein ACYDGZ_25540 [Desulfosporosinus fructosivorans]
MHINRALVKLNIYCMDAVSSIKLQDIEPAQFNVVILKEKEMVQQALIGV